VAAKALLLLRHHDSEGYALQRLFLVILALGLVALATVAFALLSPPPSGHREKPETRTFAASMFVSDAGQSHGGFEYNAEWTANLTVVGDTGMLRLTLKTGLGDALTKHEYTVTEFRKDDPTLSWRLISFSLNGNPVKLVLIGNDTIWKGQFSNYYIASWGAEAPGEEIRGLIKPTYFEGLADFWYVELRLK
jgi:hypothetical protein